MLNKHKLVLAKAFKVITVSVVFFFLFTLNIYKLFEMQLVRKLWKETLTILFNKNIYFYFTGLRMSWFFLWGSELHFNTLIDHNC